MFVCFNQMIKNENICYSEKKPNQMFNFFDDIIILYRLISEKKKNN